MENTIHQLLRFDTWLFFKIFAQGQLVFARFFYGVSRLADGYVYVLSAGIMLWYDIEHGIVFLKAGPLAFALERFSYLVIKKSVRRKRPFEALRGIRNRIQPPDRFSFPSGHTAAAFVFATLMATLYPSAALPLVVLACLVGYSRVYLGVHYPGDVLAGALLGIICAHAGLRFAP